MARIMRRDGITLLEAIRDFFTERAVVHVQDLYAHLPDDLKHSIRARVYENLGRHFTRIGRGLYVAKQDEAVCVVVEGDAWEELRKMPNQLFDALITDPPYPWLNAHLARGTTRKRAGQWSFPTREVDRALGLEFYRILKAGAHAFFFVPAETAATRVPVQGMIEVLMDCGFRFNKRLIWDKVKLGTGYNARARHEGILFMSKGVKRQPFDLSMPDVIAFPDVDPRVRRHETEKPVELLERLVRFSTEPGDAILDCFAGSCSTGRAALALGRNSVMVESEESIVAAVMAE